MAKVKKNEIPNQEMIEEKMEEMRLELIESVNNIYISSEVVVSKEDISKGYMFKGEVIKSKELEHNVSSLIQNNDIYKQFRFEKEGDDFWNATYIITYNEEEGISLLNETGGWLCPKDNGFVLEFGKIQLKKGGFSIGNGIGSIFEASYYPKDKMNKLRYGLIQSVENIVINKNYNFDKISNTY